ncbi:hypothetical protein chiPu_0017995 [Chiloscyllium punctatum]|uniref:Uncharacterized protein n=1 Tax=Chiloscyllium punctatum TaxID=137246 RepID=A0A401RKJ0_CHIPU|nr:hypothetical protein [Chiloscyllium punctatum]
MQEGYEEGELMCPTDEEEVFQSYQTVSLHCHCQLPRVYYIKNIYTVPRSRLIYLLRYSNLHLDHPTLERVQRQLQDTKPSCLQTPVW